MKKLVIYVEDVLVKTLSGNPIPKALWDFKVNWPVWNAIREYDPKEIILVSNESWIWRGWVKDHDYYSKLSFLASALGNFLGHSFKKPSIRYSIDGDWLRYPREPEEILDGLTGWDYLGRSGDKEKIKEKGLIYLETEKFLKEYGTTGPRKSIQSSQEGVHSKSWNSLRPTSGGSSEENGPGELRESNDLGKI